MCLLIENNVDTFCVRVSPYQIHVDMFCVPVSPYQKVLVPLHSFAARKPEGQAKVDRSSTFSELQ